MFTRIVRGGMACQVTTLLTEVVEIVAIKSVNYWGTDDLLVKRSRE